MIIYLLHEMSGAEDTYSNIVISAHSNESKCKKEMNRLKKISAQVEKCRNCVCSGYCIPNCEDEDCKSCDIKRAEYIKIFCEFADPYIYEWKDCGDGENCIELKCKNKVKSYKENTSYRIEPMEVIE